MSSQTKHITEHKTGGLGTLPATAICGNDITSSCLYVSALAIGAAGQYAWVSLLIVAAVLFLFRKIYAEVVGALPLNGGAYNALLNTTSKSLASVAACLTLLSYMATAVISASEATHYAHSLWHGLPVMPATVVLLAVFLALTIIGIGESSKVAVAIFITHIVTLTLLAVTAAVWLTRNGFDVWSANWNQPVEGSLRMALFLGFAAAMLGISGFESSANFVEEQAEGVFPKTLNNMWIAVSVFNPLMAILALCLIRIEDVSETALLADMGALAGGSWLKFLISIDAVLVLSGAVLTSYVGVTGLVRRMTLDRVLPQLFLKTNRRGTNHRIIVSFFLLAVSVLYITRNDAGLPDVEEIAGLYTISFLAVMALFALGNVFLKAKRARLPRPAVASWPAVLAGLTAVLVGLAGNVYNDWPLGHPWRDLRTFAIYFVPAMTVVAVMLGRIFLLKACLYFVRRISEKLHAWTDHTTTSIKRRMHAINSQQVVFFTRGDSKSNLNRAFLYVRRNEHTNRMKVVLVARDESEVPPNLRTDLAFFDEVYPEIDIEFVLIRGREFGPELIQELSEEWRIPVNFMFIGSPGNHFLYGLAELGGVRLII